MSETEQVKTKTAGWVKLLLVASLGVNLAIAGVIGGALLRRDAGEERVRNLQTRDLGFGPFVGAMGQDDRRALGKAFFKEAGGPRKTREELRANFTALLSALRSEPFDAQAFETVLMRQQQQLAGRQQVGAKLVTEQIAGMDAAARAAYADRLEEMIKRGPRPPKDPMNKGAPPQKK